MNKMIQYDDGRPGRGSEFCESDEDDDPTLPILSRENLNLKNQKQMSNRIGAINVEDVLLDCPHCHKTILYTSRFPSNNLYADDDDEERSSRTSAGIARAIDFSGFFKGSAKGSAVVGSWGGGKQPLGLKGYFSSVAAGDPQQRRRRICGLVLVLLSFVIVLSVFLQSTTTTGAGGIDLGQGHMNPMDELSSFQPIVKMKRLPHCIIIGARKCGTRALIDMLNLHPQVEKAAVEVHFFDRDDNYGKGLDWYRHHMPDTAPDQLSIEKSPSYFVTPEVPERVAGMNSSIKLFLIVREPVTRVISDYTQIYGTTSKLHNTSRSPRLEELVLHPDGSVNVHYKAIRISLYSRYLQRWLDVFPPSQIHVIDGDALIKDPYPQLREAEEFLGLQPRLQRANFYFNSTKGFYCWRRLESSDSAQTQSSSSSGDGNTNTSSPSTNLHCLNDSKGRPHPVVDSHIVSKLRRFYHPHNLRFYDMVGRDFGWPEK